MNHAFLIAAMLLGSPQAAPSPANPATAPSVSANHLALHVADPAASARFYAEVFGLTRMPARSSPTVVWLNAGAFELHLIGGRSSPVQTPRELHFALRVSDLAPVVAKLDERDVIWGNFAGVPKGIEHRSDGVNQIFLQDPDGYWIEVNQEPR